MKNRGVIIAIIAILLLIGLFAYSKFGNSSNKALPGSQNSTATSPNTLKELLSGSVSQVCSFSADGSVGKVFVANGKVKGDFEVTMEDEVVKSHMIVDGNTSYVWTEGQNMGIKMSFDPNTAVTGQGSNTSQNPTGFDPNTEVDYDCNNWSADSSVFNLPKDVTFSEFALPQQETSKDPPAPDTSTQCAYCSSLTGEEKSACLSALNCK